MVRITFIGAARFETIPPMPISAPLTASSRVPVVDPGALPTVPNPLPNLLVHLPAIDIRPVAMLPMGLRMPRSYHFDEFFDSDILIFSVLSVNYTIFRGVDQGALRDVLR